MAGVTASGFVPKLESEIFEETLSECRAVVDADFDGSPDSVSGQIVGIVSNKHAELWEVLQAVWGALSENASGLALDRLAALTGTTRNPGESDAAFRLRRRMELSDQGATTQPAMRAALSKLPGMNAVRVISNRRISTDAAGRPPKSVEALVLGTASENDIARTIWENLAAGIETYGANAENGEGEVSTSITDSEGNSQPVMYSIAQPRSAYLRITLQIDEGSYPDDDVLKQRIVDFTSGAMSFATDDGLVIAGGVDLGGTIYASRVSAAALTVPGVVSVQQVQMKGAEAAAWSLGDFALGPREYLGVAGVRGFEKDHIEVVRT